MRHDSYYISIHLILNNPQRHLCCQENSSFLGKTQMGDDHWYSDSYTIFCGAFSSIWDCTSALWINGYLYDYASKGTSSVVLFLCSWKWEQSLIKKYNIIFAFPSVQYSPGLFLKRFDDREFRSRNLDTETIKISFKGNWILRGR